MFPFLVVGYGCGVRRALGVGSTGWRRAAASLIIAVAAVTGLSAALASCTSATPGASSSAIVYVRPGGQGPGSGTRSSPYTSLTAARNAIRPELATMRSDIDVELESGTYVLTQPFTLAAADSGRNGHQVVYEAAPGAHPVVSGGQRITGWHRQPGSKDIWTASVPESLQARQLYVDGQRAEVAQGTLPVTLSQTATGYTASSTALDNWSNPTGIEMVYPSGPNNWIESRCRVASISGTAITMAQPCWDNTTLRTDPHTALGTIGNGPLTATPTVTNAYPLLTQLGQWYLDGHAHQLYYIPRSGQDMAKATAILPRLQTLVGGTGSPSAPVHDIEFRGITFSYAGWLEPNSTDGYSGVQAGAYLTGTDAYQLQGACSSPKASCPYYSYPQIPGNVDFRYDQRLTFEQDTFEHLGAAGLELGDGSQNDLVEGNRFTDTSGSGLILGGIDQPLAKGAELTSQNRIVNNYLYDVASEYQDNVALFVGYAQYTTVSHNQIDHVPYSGISIGWGGWLERFTYMGPLSNYSQGNVISDNLIFDPLQTLLDGGGIYTNGIQGTSMASGELIEGNVVLSQHNPSWAIYTDNGTEYSQVKNNVVLDALYVPLAPTVLTGISPYFSFGGCGGGPITYDGNYSVQTDLPAGLIQASPACGGHPLQGVTMGTNNVISSLSQAPSTLVQAAGLTGTYKQLLSPTPAPTAVPPYFTYPPSS